MRSLLNSSPLAAIRHSRIKLLLALVAIFVLLPSALLPGQTISYAGMQTTIPVTGLSLPIDVTIDSSGNLYIVDNQSSNITEIAPDGTQSTITSNLYNPSGIACDSAGNLYVADTNNARVLKISAGGGTQTTLGSGWQSPLQVAVDSLGDVFVIDGGLAALYELPAGGGQTQVGGAVLVQPIGLAVDSYNNVYVTDFFNFSLYEFNAGGSSQVLTGLNPYPYEVTVDRFGNIFVSNFAFNNGGQYIELYGADGSIRQLGSLTAPYGMTTDPSGNLYVVDVDTDALYKLAPGAVDLGSANVCAGSTPVNPCNQSVTLNFNVQGYFAPLYNVSATVTTQGGQNLDFTTTSNTCTGNFDGVVTTCSIGIQFQPLAPGIRLGAVNVIGQVGPFNDISRRHDSPSRVSKKARRGSVRPKANGPQGELPFSLLSTVNLSGTGMGPLAGFDAGIINTVPATLASNILLGGIRSNELGDLFIVDQANCVVSLYVPGSGSFAVAGSGSCGTPAGDGGPATQATFAAMNDVALDGAGNLYITDPSACVIREVNGQTGTINTIAGTSNTCGYTADGAAAINADLDDPFGIAVDASGNIFYSDSADDYVRRIDASSGILTTFAGIHNNGGYSGDGGPATSAQLNGPQGIAFDGTGNLYIADYANQVVRKVDASTSIITTIAGNQQAGGGYSGDGGPATSAQLYGPDALAIDAAGNLYIADYGNLLVRKVNASTGIITTAAGVYNGGSPYLYTGDGGAANLAGLSSPSGVAVDGSGNFYIADQNNNVVRSVTIASAVANFGNVNVGSDSEPINVALVNEGNAPLDLSALTISTNFNLDGSQTSCSSTAQLSAGESCELGIEFAPLSAAALTGAITLTDNVGNNPASTQTINLTGTGTTPTASQLALSGVPSTVAVGGNLGTIQVSVESSGGTVITSSSASITLTIAGPGNYSYTGTASAVNGVASFNLSSLAFSTTGSYTVTATSTALTSATASFTVSTGQTAAMLALPTLPGTLTPGSNLGTVAVSVETSGGAVVDGSTASVTLTIAGPGSYSTTVIVNAVNGVASFNLSNDALTALGSYTITATSSGLTSATASFTVAQNFTLATENGTSASQTVSPGGSAVYALTLAPAGSSFSAPITLTATGLPPGATYSFNPSSVTPGASAATTMLTVTVAATSASLRHAKGTSWGLGGFAFAMILFPWGSRRRRKFAQGSLLLLTAIVIAVGGLTSCANGGLFGGQSQTPYTITVTGTSGALTHSTTVTLIVK